MKKLMKWLGIGAGSAAGLGVIAYCGLYVASQKQLRTTWDVPVSLQVPTDSAAVARGRHVARAVAKCLDCHGGDLAGRTVIEDPMLGRVVADNITPAGVTRNYTDADWVRAIRHGVRPDGRSVVVMPSYEFYHLNDQDLGALVAYLKTVPPVERALPATRFGPLGRMLIATGAFPVLAATAIPHEAPRAPAVPPAVTPEYGAYLANVGCIGCHGPGMTGGKPPAPAGPDITGAGVMAKWSEADFRTALRTGRRPDGSVLSTEMPWPRTSELSDVEIGALYAYLKSLRPAAVAQGAD